MRRDGMRKNLDAMGKVRSITTGDANRGESPTVMVENQVSMNILIEKPVYDVILKKAEAENKSIEAAASEILNEVILKAVNKKEAKKDNKD
jgi:hypothetical protein